MPISQRFHRVRSEGYGSVTTMEPSHTWKIMCSGSSVLKRERQRNLFPKFSSINLVIYGLVRSMMVCTAMLPEDFIALTIRRECQTFTFMIWLKMNKGMFLPEPMAE